MSHGSESRLKMIVINVNISACLQSRALAGASRQMRAKLKAAYSVNDLDHLNKQADAENKLLFKQHYVSRYNPGTASTITIG